MFLISLHTVVIHFLTFFLIACASSNLRSAAESIPPPLSATSDVLEWRGGIILTDSNPNFGGLSSLNLTKDGQKANVLSDKGYRFTIKLRYDEKGWLVGEDGIECLGTLINPKGKAVKYADTEGQTQFRKGTLISQERKHVLWWYSPPMQKARVLNRPASMAKLPSNRGIEAITILKDGRLLLLAEGGANDSDQLPAWIGLPGKWQKLFYPFDGSFRPTDAALLPKGDVLVLERSVFLGMLSWRLMRIDRTSLIPNSIIQNHSLADAAIYAPRDNMEGLALRINTAGELLVYVLSDDNFSPFQNTMLLQFALHDASL